MDRTAGVAQALSHVPWSTTALRGLRIGGIVGFLLVIVLHRVAGTVKGAPGFPHQEAQIGALVVIIVWVWHLFPIVGPKYWIARDVLSLSTVSLIALYGSGLCLRSWWGTYQDYGQHSTRLSLAAAGFLLVGLAVLADLLLRIRRDLSGMEIEDPDNPARWARLGSRVASEEEDQDGAEERSSSVEPDEATQADDVKHDKAERRTSESAEAPDEADAREDEPGVGATRITVTRGRALTAVTAGLMPCLVLACAYALALQLLPGLPPTVAAQAATTAPVPDDALPAISSAAPSAVAWTKDITTEADAIDIVAGARGPLILTHEGIEAISSDDGTTLWSYRPTKATYAEVEDGTLDHPIRLVTSPDRKHVAVVIYPLASDFPKASHLIVVILDAMTGRVTAQIPVKSMPTIQMTDSAALVGRTAYSLTDGHRLWTLDKPEDWSPGYSGPAGHSTFILAVAERRDHPGWSKPVNLTLAPDSDPQATTTLPWVSVDPANTLATPAVVVVDGWVLTTQEPQVDETGVAPFEGVVINVDQVSDAGSTDVETIPVGTTSGVNAVASQASGQLVTYPDLSTLRDEGQKSWAFDRYSIPTAYLWAAALFDPATRRVTAAADSPSIGAATVGRVRTINDSGQESLAIRVAPANGQAPLEIPVPWALTTDTTERGDTEGGSPVWQKRPDQPPTIWCVASPGSHLIILDATSESEPSGLRLYRIHGVR